MVKARALIFVCSIALLAALAVACGSGNGGPTPTSAVATPTPIFVPPVPIPTGIPSTARNGGALNLAALEDPKHFDVQQEVSPALATWGPGLVYSRMMRLRSGQNVDLPSLEVECDLCQSWVQQSPTVYIFKLRSGVRWQNVSPVNGRLLTADDFVYSYNRQRTSGWPNAPLLSAVSRIEALDSLTVKITLAYPDADFLLALADGHSKIVAKEAVLQHGDLKQGPNVGTGPWIWKLTDAGVGSVFVRNADYFEKGLPFLDRLTVNVISDAETRLASFKSKLVDVLQMSPDEWAAFKADHPNAPALMYREQGAGLELALNTSKPPFDNLNLRKAMFKALDPWAANQKAWSGQAYVSLGFPAAQPDWLLPDSEMQSYFKDKAGAARALQVQSVAPLPISLELTVGNFGDEYLRYADIIAQDLRDVGFQVNVSVKNVREFGQDVWYGGKYTMFAGAPPPASTPNSYLLSVFHSKGSANTAGYKDVELDRMLERQSGEIESDARQSQILDIQRYILDKAYRFMPATRISIWTWWPRVHYFYPNFADSEYLHWARVWVDEQQ